MYKTHVLDFLGQNQFKYSTDYADLSSETLITRELGLNVADGNY